VPRNPRGVRLRLASGDEKCIAAVGCCADSQRTPANRHARAADGDPDHTATHANLHGDGDSLPDANAYTDRNPDRNFHPGSTYPLRSGCDLRIRRTDRHRRANGLRRQHDQNQYRSVAQRRQRH
jgi:hypothetical protein